MKTIFSPARIAGLLACLLTFPAAAQYIHTLEYTDPGRRIIDKVNSNTVASVSAGSTLFVDAALGSDSTGRRGRPDRPFATPWVARTNAQDGDLIVVRPGLYQTGTTNLFKAGRLTWDFQGATLRFVDIPTNSSGCGMFDDRFTGAVACSNDVIGSLTLQYNSGTNVFLNTNDCTLGYNTNALGAIVLSNIPAPSLIRWVAETKIETVGAAPVPFSLYLHNCQTGTVFRTLSDSQLLWPSNQVVITTNCPASPGDPWTVDIGKNFIWWGPSATAEVYVDYTIHNQLYAVDGYGETSSDSGELRYRANLSDGKIYLVGRSKSWKFWGEALEWKNTAPNSPTLFEFHSAGSHYLGGQKASTRGGTIFDFTNPQNSGDTNLVTWVDFDKVSGSNGWARVTHGHLRGRVGHFEQNGPANGTPGIFVTNISALVSLSGEDMYAEGTSVSHGGGRTKLINYEIYSTNRDPVLVTGSGLRLHNNVLVPGLLATNSIRAATAQTVGVYGMLLQKSNAHANITFSSGLTNVITDFDTD